MQRNEMQIQRTVVQWHVTSGHVSLPVCPPACLSVYLSDRPIYLSNPPTYLHVFISYYVTNTFYITCPYMKISKELEPGAAVAVYGNCHMQRYWIVASTDYRRSFMSWLLDPKSASSKPSKLLRRYRCGLWTFVLGQIRYDILTLCNRH